MDYKDILPLLLKGQNPEMAGVLSAMSSGDSSKLLETFMGKEGNNKELLTMLNLMRSNQKKPLPEGLKPIYSIAPKDILGVMVKYYKGSV